MVGAAEPVSGADDSPKRSPRVLELIEVARDAVQRGLVLASAGNLSVRVSATAYALTAAGTWLDRLTPDDFAILPLPASSDDVAAARPRPSSEWKLHERAYLVRPDAQCVLHLHPRQAVVLASIGVPIRLLTLDHAFYVRSIGVTPFHHNGSDELADTAASALREHDCVVMQHHGCTVVADTVEMAYRRALNLEDAAKSTALALSLGDTATTFPPEALAELHHS